MIDQLLSTDLFLNATTVLEAGVFGYVWSALISSVVLIACAYLLPGVHIDNFVSALILAVIVGAIVSVVGMVLHSFGWVGSLVITTGALIAGDKLMDSVKLDEWWWAAVVAVIVSVFASIPTFL